MTLEFFFGKPISFNTTKAPCLKALVLLALLGAATATWGANVLIMNGVESSVGGGNISRGNATNNLQAELVSAGHTVTVLSAVPTDISAYDIIWDIDFVHALSTSTQEMYLAHLKVGKQLFLIGENQFMGSSTFEPRNSSILALVGAAGGGSLTFQQAEGDDLPEEGGPQMVETVQPPFTGPNPISTVTFFSSGSVTTAGNGQFVTLRIHSTATTASAIAFNRLVVVLDVNFLEGIYAPAQSQPFLRNLIAYAPEPASPEIGNIIGNVGRPFGVAVHGGFAYVADPSSHTVWKVAMTAPFDKTPVAGIGWKTDVDPLDWQGYNGDGIEATQAQLDNPSGVAVDSSGNIYIADTGNHAIRKIAAGSSFITTVAGIPTSYAVGESTAASCTETPDPEQCIPATSLRLFGPRALAVDEDGDVYIADRMNQQVKKLYTSGGLSGFIFVVAGVAGYPGGNDGPAAGPAFCTIDECTLAARLNSPVGVAVDGEGIVYIADEGNNKIRRVTLGGNVSTVQAGTLLRPTGVAVSSSGGTIYIADYGNHRIRRATECSSEGCEVVTVAGTGTPGSSGGIGDPATSVQLNSPIALTLDDNLLYIADMLNGRILSGDFTAP